MMLSLLLLVRPPSETKFTELELELSGDSGRRLLGGVRGLTSFKISMAYSKALSW